MVVKACRGAEIYQVELENAFKDVQHSFLSQLLETFLSKFKKVTLWDNAAVKKCKDEFGRDALTEHNADIYEIWPRADCHKIDYSGTSTWSCALLGLISSTCSFMASSPTSPCTWAVCFLSKQRRTSSTPSVDDAATHVADKLLASKRDEDERDGPSFVKMLEAKMQMLKGADPHWMVVHSFFASQSEENSDSRFAQQLLECLPPEEKSSCKPAFIVRVICKSGLLPCRRACSTTPVPFDGNYFERFRAFWELFKKIRIRKLSSWKLFPNNNSNFLCVWSSFTHNVALHVHVLWPVFTHVLMCRNRCRHTADRHTQHTQQTDITLPFQLWLCSW